MYLDQVKKLSISYNDHDDDDELFHQMFDQRKCGWPTL